ncbi:MAG TPA: M56 family metallopeptidase [Euzebya sp.]|nr:M56 family metallopeptidase [Euzebya sp.]
MEAAVDLPDLVEGLGVSLSLQSFAARALLGSVVAALLAGFAARSGWVRSGRARRTLVLAPVVAAIVAAIACTTPGSTFLPALLVSADTGQTLEVFGGTLIVRRLEWLLVAYVATATFLLLRRGIGHLAINRYVRGASRSTDTTLNSIVRRISSKLGIQAPPLLLVRRCPGGAFTSGLRHPVVVLDPALVGELDDRELEGLIAHELAHIARRDVALNTVVGVVRDLTFFIPPLNLACRWLRHEQEHSADDLASDSTGRPAALASSILKVWEGSAKYGRYQPAAMACATMTPMTPMTAGPVTVRLPVLQGPGLRGGAKQIAERVVRLIERGAPLTLRRQRVELALAMGAVMLATGVTVVLPAQVDAELLLAQWSRPPDRPVESPAMAAFRATVPEQTALAAAVVEAGSRPLPNESCDACLQLESGADWRNQTMPRLQARAPGWQDGGRIWQAAPQGSVPTPPSARTLWGVDSEAGRLGFFLVNSERS